MMFTDPDGRMPWLIPVIVGVIAGTANVAANWDNIDGFWDGFSTFMVGGVAGAGAGAGAGACFTGGWSTAALIGYGAGVGAAVATNNEVVAQTGRNFEGFDKVDWGKVGESAGYGAIAGAVGAGVGSWAASSKFLVNGINSPMARSMVVTPLASGAAHMAAGTTAGLVNGQSLDQAVQNSFNGIGQSMLTATLIAGGTTMATSYARGVNPWNGRNISKTNYQDANSATTDLSATLKRIKEGGTNPHRNDGGVFHNREGLLPQKPDGYYREYVHPTPGVQGP